MAFYIMIEKVEETEEKATYCFKIHENKNTEGFFQIEKKTGEVLLTKPMPNDEQKHYFNRAAFKIIKAWKLGNLPDFTEWAS